MTYAQLMNLPTKQLRKLSSKIYTASIKADREGKDALFAELAQAGLLVDKILRHR